MARSKSTTDWKELTEYEHIRLRTQVYLGYVKPSLERRVNWTFEDGIVLEDIEYSQGLFTAFREILDNAVDEVIGRGQGNKIDVSYNHGIFKVADNGRGIPHDKVVKAFATARSGTNFDERDNVVGANGIGATATAFTSSYMKITSRHRGETSVTRISETNEDQPKIDLIERKKISRGKGTIVEWKPSKKVWPTDVLPTSLILGRCAELAFAYPKMKFSFNGTPLKAEDYLKGHTPIECIGTKGDVTHKFFVLPNFVPDGSEHCHAVINSVAAFRGGDHVNVFRDRFYKILRTQVDAAAGRKKINPSRSLMQQGVLIIGFTQMDAPDFENAVKDYLGAGNATSALSSIDWDSTERHIRLKRKDWLEEIVTRARSHEQNKSDDIAKKKTRRQKKVAKLLPATGKHRDQCILIIGEGDSALNAAEAVRNPSIHGILPLTGKTMNAYKNTVAKVISSKGIADVINALGLTYGEKADRKKLDYGCLWIATDEDTDGGHILVLVSGLLYKYWPELFDEQEPFVKQLNTPFVILKKGKSRKYIYGDQYSSFDPSDYKGWEITRAKGLGTLGQNEWEDVMKDPQLTELVDDGSLEDTFEMLLGVDVSLRKDWLSESEQRPSNDN